MKGKIDKYKITESGSSTYYITEAEIAITAHKIISWLICEFEKNTYIMPLRINNEMAAKELSEEELKVVTKKYFKGKSYKSSDYVFVMSPVEYPDGESELSYMADYIQSIQ